MMDCRTVKENLPAYSVEGLLPAQTVAAIKEHLAKCPPCDDECQCFLRTIDVISLSFQPLPSHQKSTEMWRTCSREIHERIESKRVASKRPAWWGWATNSPTIGWAAVGGALLILGGAWWLTPQDNSMQPGGPQEGPGPLVEFRQPPAVASAMVDHHAAMANDPFADHVGSSLVSYSATTPSRR